MAFDEEMKGYVAKDIRELIELKKKADFLANKIGIEVGNAHIISCFNVQVNEERYGSPVSVLGNIKTALDTAGIDYVEEESDFSKGKILSLYVDGLEVYGVDYLEGDMRHE